LEGETHYLYRVRMVSAGSQRETTFETVPKKLKWEERAAKEIVQSRG